MYTLDNIQHALILEPIVVEYDYGISSAKFWRVAKDMQVQLSNGMIVTIPAGMPTDFSTVPKILWGLFPPFGDFLFAALLHDYLYIYNPEGITRAMADKEMLIWSRVLNGDRTYNSAITYTFKRAGNYIRYYTVRALGWLYWYGLLHFNNTKKFT